MEKKQLALRFNANVKIAVDYMVQEHPGQYSGDRNAKVASLFSMPSVQTIH
ncbi:hypothetical protein KUH03_08285 [Sphingobacterium sp. E70]|uniref:hypothetical protein n=1 Tax=Sphingobacterium sp. E70 TaxID=2853439 RepID=UPI00211CA9AC|nr:hypothetical protein [Sphingobacterium sp. E70]ULT26814.1 hypothetical protein KUH03_08285 [Sphingobacterium sp. E70]